MVSIKDLLRSNLVVGGAELIWKRTKTKQTFIAVLNSNGTITTSDGAIHKTPSGAAKHLNGNKPVDGWNTWKIKSSGISLSELREKLSSL
jgi:hypothetical protein